MEKYYATVIVMFEHPGDSVPAQKWVLDKLSPLGNITVINLTKWVEPYANQATLVERYGNTYLKYTCHANLVMDATGFADAQTKIVDALAEDDTVKRLNIQNVNLAKA